MRLSTECLAFFRKYEIGKFPKDARTLLDTPINIETRSFKPGEYRHLGLNTALTEYIKETNKEVNVKLYRAVKVFFISPENPRGLVSASPHRKGGA